MKMNTDLLSVKTADGTTAKINAYVRMFSDRLRREETERWKDSSKELIVVDLTAQTIEMVSFFKVLIKTLAFKNKYNFIYKLKLTKYIIKLC